MSEFRLSHLVLILGVAIVANIIANMITANMRSSARVLSLVKPDCGCKGA
jgi:hypothetical protein